MLAYFGHHKCASTWIANILKDIAAVLSYQDKLGQASIMSDDALSSLDCDIFISSNTAYRDIEKIDYYRAFHVIRDPRDIIVSGYFSHLKTHKTDGWPQLEAHRANLMNCNKEEGLYREIEFSAQFIQHIMDWNYRQNEILEVKMESLIADPKREFRKILIHLGVYNEDYRQLLSPSQAIKFGKLHRKLGFRSFASAYISDSILSYIIEKHSFKNITGGRKQGEEDTNSHYRKGEAGDWKNHLNKGHLTYLEKLFPEYTQLLGYAEHKHAPINKEI